MAVLRDALAPLAARMIREHQVLHIAAELPADERISDQARTEILKWAQARSGGRFPDEAMAGRSFELLAAGRNSAAVEVNLPDIAAWAFRQEDPDKMVAGRIWTSEAILWRTPDCPPRFAARLIVGSPEAELEIAPAAPGYVRQLADKLGLNSGGRPLSSSPIYVNDPKARRDFLDLLTERERGLPVIGFSVATLASLELTVDVKKLAASLCGLAYVAIIPPEQSWLLTDHFGKRLSVFDRAVRIYMPGFDEDADPYDHPLWLGTRLVNPDDAARIERQIRMHVAHFSTRNVRMGADILPFAQLRSISRKVEQDHLASSGASEAEQLFAAKNRIDALTRELSEAKEIEKLALDEEHQAQLRAEEAERREHTATTKIQILLEQLARAGAVSDQNDQPPQNWKDFEEWCDQALVGRVILTSAAKRGCKKALFTDVEQATRCLRWLATICRDRLLEGGGSLRDMSIEDGIRNSPCGGDEFEFDWQARRLNAAWHIKNGGNTHAPQNCLRIYYGWDERTRQIIVADMPAHRRTGAT